MAIPLYRELAGQLANDPGGKLKAGSVDAAIAAAVIRYSDDRPDSAIEMLSASDGGLGLPEGWQEGFSRVVKIEYPIGHRPPTYLKPEDWFMYTLPATTGTPPVAEHTTIELVASPPEGANAQCIYTVKRLLDANRDTIPSKHMEALCCWAAALLCDEISAAYSANTDSTIQADSVDQTSPARSYAQRANTLRNRYYDALGIDPKKTAAAGCDVSFRDKNSLGGSRLTHPLPWWQGRG